MKLLSLLLLALISNFAVAGYENTNWGDSMESVKKKYPDGKELPEKNGIVTYYVIKEIADNPGSIVQFNFHANKLMQVMINIHASQPFTEEEAEKSLALIKQKLAIKYKTKGEDMADLPVTVFSLPKSDVIMASKTKVLDKGFAPSLVYRYFLFP